MEPGKSHPARVNLRTPDVMSHVQAQVESHYRSEFVEMIRARGGVLVELKDGDIRVANS